MKGVRELKVRIKSVTNIQKITRAMEMVAATKLRRLQERALATRPFADRIEAMMRRVAAHTDESASPLLRVPEVVDREATFVVGADKGLCGSYNSHLFRHVGAHLRSLQAEGVEADLHVFGRRPDAWLRAHRGITPVWTHPGSVEHIDHAGVRRALEPAVQGFLSGEVQRVRVIFTRMRTLASFVPATIDLLPLSGGLEADEEGTGSVDYILEPTPEIIMRRLLPRYLETQLYAAVLESLASEFASRRMAMKSATDAADDMLGALGMEYNKARQAGITSELLDIVGGVVAQGG